ncbi:hypothetical protein [Afifella sp. YEN Y35]|uniref:hypothetical protein n=1 Tax=Afifella sp. YEN Y35 TaxID=3388337 RepID=UPI0039E0CA4C
MQARFHYFRLAALPESRKSVLLAASMRPDRSGRGARECPMASRQTDATDQKSTSESGREKTLNFRVSDKFKREFKGFAASQGLSMTELLKEGYALAKNKRKK